MSSFVPVSALALALLAAAPVVRAQTTRAPAASVESPAEPPSARLVREALAERALGRSRVALALIDRAVRAAARSGAPVPEAVARRHRARILRDLGRGHDRRAEADLEHARTLLGVDGPAEERIAVELALAALAGASGDPWLALGLYAPARELALRSGLWSHAAQAALGMAVAAQSAGDIEAALVFCREAVRAAERSGAVAAQRQARLYLTTALVLAGHPRDALALAAQLAPEFVDRPVPRRQLAVAVGLARLALGLPLEALAAADEAILTTGGAQTSELLDELHFVRARALIDLGAWPPALQAAEAGRRMARSPAQSASADALRGRALLGSGRRADAIAALEAWHRSTEGLRSRGSTSGVSMVRFYHSERLAALQTLVELYVQSRRWNEAFAAAQRLKARWFSETVALEHARGEGLLDGDHRVRRALLEGIERRDASPLPTLPDVQRALPPTGAVLDYVHTQDALVVFVISRQAVAVQRYPVPRHAVAAMVERLRDALARPGPMPAADTSALSLLVTEPLRALPGNATLDTLTLIPTGHLGDVPFSALPDARGRALVERFDLVRAPSVSTWLELGRRGDGLAAPDAAALALADPDGDLVAARGEAEALRLYYTNVEVLSGPAANRTEVERRAPHVGLIEVAVHTGGGQAESGPHLRLAGPGGQWAPRDIATLTLAGPLVTLFACHSSGGPRSTSEEAATLDRAFVLAGASGVVSSLWPVTDTSAALFSSLFHERLAAGTPPARALSGAQRAMLRMRTPGASSPTRGLIRLEEVEASDDVRAWAGYVLTAGPTAP